MIKKCTENISFEELVKTKKRLKLSKTITPEIYDLFVSYLEK